LGFISQIRQSSSSLFRAVPRDRQALLSLHKQKTALLREAGVKRIFYDSCRTAINLVMSINSRSTGSSETLEKLDAYLAYPFFKYMPDTLAQEICRYLPPLTLPLTLVDRKNGYICYQLPINDQTMAEIEGARSFVSASLGNYGYVGWSDEIDRSHDQFSTYFIVKNVKGDIVATARITHKTNNNKLPIELGQLVGGSQYSFDEEKGEVIEINSFAYRKGSRRALLSLFPILGRYASLKGVNRIFCLLDESNERTSALYSAVGFKQLPQYGEKIHFPGYGCEVEGVLHPTCWTILALEPVNFIKHGLKAILFAQAN